MRKKRETFESGYQPGIETGRPKRHGLMMAKWPTIIATERVSPILSVMLQMGGGKGKRKSEFVNVRKRDCVVDIPCCWWNWTNGRNSGLRSYLKVDLSEGKHL